MAGDGAGRPDADPRIPILRSIVESQARILRMLDDPDTLKRLLLATLAGGALLMAAWGHRHAVHSNPPVPLATDVGSYPRAH